MRIYVGIIGAVLAVGGATEVFAANCSGPPAEDRLNDGQISVALSAKRINAVSPAGEDWKEDHCAGGDLYKVGDGTAVDPRVKRGTWSIVGTGNDHTVRYSYTGGSTYDWAMYQNKTTNTVYFCDGSAEVARIVSSAAAGTPCN